MPPDAVAQAPILLLAAAVAGAGVFHWLTQPMQLSPDPWSAEIDEILRDPDVLPLCHRCMTPHEARGWFCPNCGAAAGPYNNYMPFVCLFSEGEVLRAGTSGHFQRSPLTVAGYLLYSLATYSIFAPFYWYSLFKNLRRQKADEAKAE
jgi:hypothetical protein